MRCKGATRWRSAPISRLQWDSVLQRRLNPGQEVGAPQGIPNIFLLILFGCPGRPHTPPSLHIRPEVFRGARRSADSPPAAPRLPSAQGAQTLPHPGRGGIPSERVSGWLSPRGPPRALATEPGGWMRKGAVRELSPHKAQCLLPAESLQPCPTLQPQAL